MTVKYTFEQLGYRDSELQDLILSLTTGSTLIQNGELKQIRYKLYYNSDDQSSASAIKINGGLNEITEFSEFLSQHKRRMNNWGNEA